MYYADITRPDDWFLKMLSPGRDCPKQLEGIFWMDGNYAPEIVMAFQDANWVSPTTGLKLAAYNWSHDETCFGSVMANGTACAQAALVIRVEVSPNKKWIMLSAMPSAADKEPNGGNCIWMYRPDEGEEFFWPDGSQVTWEPGDFMRLSWEKPFDASSDLVYQYMARRVAVLGETGLVKTKAYEKLLEENNIALPYANTCCGYGNCNLSKEEFLKNFKAQNHRQQILFAPTPQVM